MWSPPSAGCRPGRKFDTIGDIVRTLGIHTEEDDPGHTAT